jgi:glycosyltransferase involved in cell wall biosynthesis
MRILYHHRIASKDGQITHIEEMVHALEALGHEVRLVGPEVHRGDSGQGGSAGWVGRLKATLPTALYELAEAAYAFVVYHRLMRAIRNFRPDLIYERYALFQPAGVWASRRTGVPLLLEVNAPYAIARRKYGHLSNAWLADGIERFTFRGATRVFPVTRVLADILERMGVEPRRITVIPNAINPKDFENLPDADTAKAHWGVAGRTVIGFIGFVREWDQLDRIVSWLAAREATDPATLMIVGDGPVRPALEAQAQRLGIAHKLVFTGVLPRSEVPSAAMAFDIALQTALVPYASPLCLFEYMAIGKPILAPDQPNHHEVLVKDVDCCMYRPDAPHSIELELDRMMADAERRHSIAVEARKTLDRRDFHWSANAGRVLAAATELVPTR